MKARIAILACAALLAAPALAAPQPLLNPSIVPPAVPVNIQAPADVRPFLQGHAVGTQNYICLPSGSGFSWALFGPQATLFTSADEQIVTHFLSANPDEAGTPRPTWQSSRDTSAVWGLAIGASSDSDYVAPGAIPWVLLSVEGRRDGPTGGNKLTAATHIHRVNTSGGVAPEEGCAQASDVGVRALVPYSADYFFYTNK